MSPEELDASVNLGIPDAFKQMDVYSMALVMWEVTSRCSLTGAGTKYNVNIMKTHRSDVIRFQGLVEHTSLLTNRPWETWSLALTS